MARNGYGKQILQGERLVAVDVGAARGLLPHWRSLSNLAHLYLFEPDRDAHTGIRANLGSAMNGGMVHLLGIALSGTGGARTLHVLHTQSGSSLLPLEVPQALDYVQNSHVFPINEVTVQTRTLRDVMDEQKEPRVDMIKLDTQGTELEILEGLDLTRRQLLLSVELEIGMLGHYRDQATFSQVHAFMEDHGLEIFDLTPKRYHLVRNQEVNYSKVFRTFRSVPGVAPRLIEVDAVFFRRPESLLKEHDVGGVRKLITAYCVYGFFSQAYQLAEHAQERGIFDISEKTRITASVVDWQQGVYRKRVVYDVAGQLLHKISNRFLFGRA